MAGAGVGLSKKIKGCQHQPEGAATHPSNGLTSTGSRRGRRWRRRRRRCSTRRSWKESIGAVSQGRTSRPALELALTSDRRRRRRWRHGPPRRRRRRRRRRTRRRCGRTGRVGSPRPGRRRGRRLALDVLLSCSARGRGRRDDLASGRGWRTGARWRGVGRGRPARAVDKVADESLVLQNLSLVAEHKSVSSSLSSLCKRAPPVRPRLLYLPSRHPDSPTGSTTSPNWDPHCSN